MSAFYCTQSVTEACFIVRDHNGQALAYVYFEEEPGRRAAHRDLLHCSQVGSQALSAYVVT
jgi:hypothetical protein